jgi:hypothetical protein
VLAGEEAGAASALGKIEKIVATAGITTPKVFILKGLGGFDGRFGIISTEIEEMFQRDLAPIRTSR